MKCDEFFSRRTPTQVAGNNRNSTKNGREVVFYPEFSESGVIRFLTPEEAGIQSKHDRSQPDFYDWGRGTPIV
jgi:hypothetical protein